MILILVSSSSALLYLSVSQGLALRRCIRAFRQDSQSSNESTDKTQTESPTQLHDLRSQRKKHSKMNGTQDDERQDLQDSKRIMNHLRSW